VSAWSEIAAMTSSFLVALAFFIARKMGMVIPSHISLLSTVAVTSVVWIATTFLAPPTDEATLESFFTLVRPSGPGWTRIARSTGVSASADALSQGLLGWLLGCTFVYSALFGTGSLLYGRMPQFWTWLVVFALSGAGMFKVLRGYWTTS
jgi:hypothetical protein